MRMRSPGIAAVAAAALLLGQQATIPAPKRYDGDIVFGATLGTDVCNMGNAARISLEEALRSAGSTGEQCFAIDGFWRSDGLFLTLADARMTWSNIAPALMGRRLGVYGAARLMARARKDARHVTLVGQLRHCDSAWPGVAMVAGYCHHTGGAFLIISQAIALRR